MFTLALLLYRKPGASTEEYQTYWHDVHGPIAAKMPGLKGYVQLHGQPDAEGNVPVDGIAELTFDNARLLMQAAFASPRARRRWRMWRTSPIPRGWCRFRSSPGGSFDTRSGKLRLVGTVLVGLKRPTSHGGNVVKPASWGKGGMRQRHAGLPRGCEPREKRLKEAGCRALRSLEPMESADPARGDGSSPSAAEGGGALAPGLTRPPAPDTILDKVQGRVGPSVTVAPPPPEVSGPELPCATANPANLASGGT